MAHNRPLEIGIIGAGIVGLSAAIGMGSSGHIVELFERSDFESSAGISLALAPNATRVLTKWGIDLEALNRADANEDALKANGGVQKVEQVRHVDGTSGKTTWKEDLSDWIRQYGNSLNFMRYRDLHKGLLDQSKALGVSINLNEQVVDMDCGKATLTTAEGKVVQKDIIIVAAGWNCPFIPHITGKVWPYVDTGFELIRFLTPANDPNTNHLFDGNPEELCYFQNFPAGVMIVTYRVQGGLTRAVNILVRKRQRGPVNFDTKQSRNANAREELAELAKKFDPEVAKLLMKASDENLFSSPMWVRDPLENYANGKAVIIGDAASLMLPIHGQGASINIEALGSLQVLLDKISSGQVEERLKIFEKLRLGRTAPVQIFSNMPMGPDGYGWMMEKIKPYWDQSKPLPPPGTKPHEPYFCHYLYCYNSFEVAKQAIADAEVVKCGVAPISIPNGHANGVNKPLNGIIGHANGVGEYSNQNKNLQNGTNGVNGHTLKNGDINTVPSGGPHQVLHVPQVEKRTNKDANELIELAQTCVKSAVLVNDYFDNHPGTNPLTCVKFPSMDEKANDARLKLRNAAKELYELTTGPQEILMEQCILSLQWINALRYLTVYGIPDMIPRNGKISYSVLAKMCRVDVAQLKQNLRFAISFRFFAEPDPIHVEHTNSSLMLVEGSPQRPFTQWLTGDCAPMIAHQLDALKKWGHGSQEPNETAVNAAYGSTGDFYQFLASDPVRDRRFGAAIQMSTAVTQSALEHIKSGFPWQDIGHGTIVDVGGHLGHTAIAIAEAAPNAQVVVQDRPEVVLLAQDPAKTIVPSSLSDRIMFEDHDFFTTQKTPGDVFFYRKTLLNYTDKYAAKMIQALSPILKAGNRLVIMDFVLSEKPIATHTAERYYRAVDLQMRVYYNCKYRSLDEWKDLVSCSEPRLKFEAIRIPSAGGLAVVSFLYE